MPSRLKLSIAAILLALGAMNVPTHAVEPKLVQAARERFPTMTPAEAELFQAVAEGRRLDLRPKNLPSDEGSTDARWPESSKISLDCLVWLCASRAARDHVGPSGVRIAGARIEPGGDDSSLRSIDVPFGLSLNDCYFPQGISFANTSFRDVSLDRCRLDRSLDADGLSVARSFRATQTTFRGDVNLRRLRAGDNVDFSGARVQGTVHLSATKIDGDLRWTDATIDATKSGAPDCDAIALNLDLARIDGTLYLDGEQDDHAGFSAHGVVRLVLARLGGNLDCWNGRFRAGCNPSSDGPAPDALLANGLQVDGSVFFAHGMSVRGKVSLRTARIEHYLNIYELNAGRAPAFGDASIDLQACRVETLNCDTLSWTRPGRLAINGLAYERIELVRQSGEVETQLPLQEADFLAFLAQQSAEPFFPQPYEHLAEVLRREGFQDKAREVLIEKDRTLGARTRHGVREFLWLYICGPITGFGHDPLRGFRWLIGIWIVGAAVFAVASRRGWMVSPATLEVPWQPAASGHDDSPTRLQPLMYSLDVLLPIIDLGQASRWTPDRRRPGGVAVQWFHWGLVLVGWTLTTLVVAGITGLVRT